jgi:hypothetical protein
MTAHLTLTTCTPGEAERIIDVSTAQQRDWRRRGFLPHRDGHARFDIFDLAEMWTIKLLADRGIGPQLAMDVAALCAVGMAWHALAYGDAYDGDHNRVFEWQPEMFAALQEARAEVARMRAELRAGNEAPEENLPATHPFKGARAWGTQADWLRKQVFLQRKLPRVIPARFFIWWPDGTHLWAASVDDSVRDGLSDDPRFVGAVVFLDLLALGGTLLDRFGKPLVHVEIDEPEPPKPGE